MTLSVQEAWRRYYPPVREKCRRVLAEPQEADDVAQETFIKCWRSPEVLRGDSNRVLAWLYVTATRACIDRLRSRAQRASPIEVEVHAPNDVESATASRQVLSRLVSVAEPDELEAAVLSRIDLLTQPEIARLLDTSERTVRRLLTSFDERVAGLRAEMTS